MGRRSGIPETSMADKKTSNKKIDAGQKPQRLAAARLFAFGVALVLLLAAFLRLWGAGWGLPSAMHYFSYHPDENVVLMAAMRVNPLAGVFDPGFYNYGSLYIYFTSFAILLGQGWGLIRLPESGGLFSQIGEFSKLFMAGRMVSVLLGVATVYVTYALGRRLYGRRAGLAAALIMALLPIHVMHSKFLAVDVTATFFVALSLLYAAKISEEGRWADYIAAGIFAGLAAATKYNAGLVILAPAAAHLVSGRRVVSARLLLLPVAALVVFLAGTPGIFINPRQFMHDFTYELMHVRTGHGFVFEGTGSGFVYHYTHSLLAGMGLPLLILSTAGTVLAAVQRRRGQVALLSFLVAYYIVIGAAEVRFARYTLLLLPVLAVFAAGFSKWGIESLAKRGRRAGRIGVALLAIALIYTGAYSSAIDCIYARTDTRDSAAAWIESNIPHGSGIMFPTVPWFYTPPVSPYFGALNPEDRYIKSLEVSCYRLIVDKNQEWNTGALKESGWAVLSSFEYEDRLRIRNQEALDYFGALEQDYRLVRRCKSVPSIFGIRVPVGAGLPHDMSYASPEILIYKRDR